MTSTRSLASQLNIKLDGVEVRPAVMSNVVGVTVDQHAHLPDMFTIRITDPELIMLDDGPFDLTKPIEIVAEQEDGRKSILIRGEITALEPRFGEGMEAELVVQGFDLSHRLYRECKSRAFVNMKDSDIAAKIAQDGRLQSAIDTTATPYSHIYQDNQSDLAFLRQRAWRIGFECFVEKDTLYFRRPSVAGGVAALTWGDDLLSFQPRISLAEQVDEVIVKGWDAAKQSPIVGRAVSGRLYPDIGEPKDGATWAKSFRLPGKLIIVDQPVAGQSEADTLAAARLDEISGAFIEAEGIAFRRPDIKAGRGVKLEGLGKRLSGIYLVTAATHEYTPEGLRTIFAVRGTRTGTFAEQAVRRDPLTRRPGVVIGVVTNTRDPEDWGRVKVKFPWLADDVESEWARVVGAGAGTEAGFYAVPEVGDEVVVAFELGDINRPCVLGGLWNGRDAVPPDAAAGAAGDKPKGRVWRSRTGHCITLDDTKNKVVIVTRDGQTITLDDSGITLESTRDLNIKAKGNVNIEAQGQVNVKGSLINLN
ncbi:MAG TPA: VgrG-related protein [Promineifilum sp.]|nr:VgrG-related protein [Promineifilum sp.]